MRIATWNVEWAVPGSGRGRAVADLLSRLGADVLCVTEGRAGLLPPDGHAISGGEDWGYGRREGRRKVLLWSRRPWRDVDPVGAPGLPPGRYVAGVTDTPVGPLEVIGTCVPWRDAHVRTGRRDAAPWGEHRAYLDALAPLLDAPPGPPRVLLGDLNQRIPRRRAPVAAAEDLARALSGMSMLTAGAPAPLGEALIDHIAVSPALRAGRAWA